MRSVSILILILTLLIYVLDPRSRGATQIHHFEPRTFPAQGTSELPCLSSSPRKDEQRTAHEWPRLPLTRESRATNELTALPQSPFSFPLYNRKSNARASRLSHVGSIVAVRFIIHFAFAYFYHLQITYVLTAYAICDIRYNYT